MVKRFLVFSTLIACCSVVHSNQIEAGTDVLLAPQWASYRDQASGVSVDFPGNVFVVDAGRPVIGVGPRISHD